LLSGLVVELSELVVQLFELVVQLFLDFELMILLP
jgi:hypothetical protein